MSKQWRQNVVKTIAEIEGWANTKGVCSEQNSLADTRGNGYIADKLRMMMMYGFPSQLSTWSGYFGSIRSSHSEVLDWTPAKNSGLDKYGSDLADSEV